MALPKIQNVLAGVFPPERVKRILAHYSGLIEEFQKGEWENALGKAGKFIEAVLKMLYVHVGRTAPTGRRFKADPIITGLAQIPEADQHDSVRLLLPRACRFVYDISSNRGGRHDPHEVDPNIMDSNVVVMTCSWILAEMLRYAAKGTMPLGQAKDLVDSLVARQYPRVEEVEGRVYLHAKEKSAPDVALVALAYQYPGRVERGELIATIRRNGFNAQNAQMAVKRIMRFVDDDGAGRLRLLSTGLQRAEAIMKPVSRGRSA